MKRILLYVGMVLLTTISNAQIAEKIGLEKIVVEKFYVSNEADSIASGGVLPVGSVTYRIYADLLPKYGVVAVSGLALHPIFFETSTFFYNNEDRGAVNPSLTTYDQCKTGTVLLDSWITIGAACKGYYGVPKSNDDGVNTLVNSDGALKNNDPFAGIPLTTQDGMIKSNKTALNFSSLGIADSVSQLLDATTNTSANGQIIKIIGQWFNLTKGGVKGVDSLNNNFVLLAQLTTNGIFKYKINVEVTDSNGLNGTNTFLIVASDPRPDNPDPNSLQIRERVIPNGNLAGEISVDTKIVASNKSETEVNVYPNPVKNIVTVDITGITSESKIKYQLFDVLGSVISSNSIKNNKEKIDVSIYPSGVYYLQLTVNNNQVITRKIIKE